MDKMIVYHGSKEKVSEPDLLRIFPGDSTVLF